MEQRFSERIGKIKARDAIQIEGMDKRLVNRLWNVVLESFLNKLRDYKGDKVLKFIWAEFFINPIDEIPSFSDGSVYFSRIVDYIKKWYFISNWYEKYDLIEFLAKLDVNELNISFFIDCNEALEIEMSGFRLAEGGHLVQITSEQELKEIENAVTSSSKWKPVSEHLNTALECLSDRKSPDYRNSIKESISAVESLCKIITNDDGATLGKALSQIEKEYSIHKALKSAFSSLYGYTSDSGGIRHALLEDNVDVSMEEALFMLVSCSAFINYLKNKVKND